MTQREFNIFQNRSKDVYETADVAAALLRAVEADPAATSEQKLDAATILEKAKDVVKDWDELKASLGIV